MRDTTKWVPPEAGWRRMRNHMLALATGCLAGSGVSIYAYQQAEHRMFYAFGAMWLGALALVCLVTAYETHVWSKRP